MRLLAISLTSIAIVIMILFSAHIWGLKQPYEAYSHPLLNPDKPVWAAQISTSDDLIALQQLKPGSWAELPVRITSDKSFFVISDDQAKAFMKHLQEQQEKTPHEPIYRSHHFSEYSEAELKRFFSYLVPLKDFYSRFPSQVFALKLSDNTPEVHAYLAKELAALNADSRTMILSDTHVLLTSTKEQKPEWIYGSSRADITRLLSFESLWILTATPFKADVLTTPLTHNQRPTLKKSVVDEIHRRKKLVFVTNLNAREVELAKGLGVNGYFFTSIAELRQALDQHPAP